MQQTKSPPQKGKEVSSLVQPVDGDLRPSEFEIRSAGTHTGNQWVDECQPVIVNPVSEAVNEEARCLKEAQSALGAPQVGDVVTQPDGTKVLMGIDGETFPYFESDSLFETIPFFDDEGLESSDGALRIGKGEQVKVQFLSFEPKRCRVVRHKWFGGMLPVCPQKTSEELLAKEDHGRCCHLCDSLPTIVEHLMPVLVHEAGHGHRASILRLNERMWRQFDLAIRAGADPLKLLFVAGRNDDEFGSYFIKATEETAPELKREVARPGMSELSVEAEDALVKFSETIRNSNGIEPQPGRVAKWQRIFPGVPLVGFWWGRKEPVRAGYLDEGKVREWMREPNWLKRMDDGCGIALFLTSGYAAIDLDRDEDVAEFIKLNPWAKDCMSTRGGRGIKFFVKLKGEYPHEVIHAFFKGEHVGEFRGATTAILDNLHPSGRLYEAQNEGNFPEIEYKEIVWLQGWKAEAQHCRIFESDVADSVEGGLLDLSKLKNVHPHPSKQGALLAQCPACVEGNSDKSGDHLIIFDEGEGKFGCAVDQSAEHYSRIFALARREELRLHSAADKALVAQYGQPLFFNAKGTLTGLNERFFAARFQRMEQVLYESAERAFYQYRHETGLWRYVSEDWVRERLSAHIVEYGQAHRLSLESKATTARVTAIAQALKGVTERRGAFTRRAGFVHVSNGIVRLSENGQITLEEFSPDHYSRNQCPFPYLAAAQCPRFAAYMQAALPAEDVTLLQKFFGLALAGANPAQRFVILDGPGKTGKSTFAKIVELVVGTENCAQLRTELLFERFEVYRFLGKTLLLSPDVPGDFLSRPSASRIKALVGNDPLSAEKKGSNEVFNLTGNFNILITSNSRLRIRLDGDLSAWRRRLIIFRFEHPPQRRIANFAEQVVAEEGAGVLRWALDGLLLARGEIAQSGDLLLTKAQEARVDALLAESDSLKQFVVEGIEAGFGDVASAELVPVYFAFCAEHEWAPQSARIVEQNLRDLILEIHGVSQCHNLIRGGHMVRGWRGVSLREDIETKAYE
jgi:P4 family phage/plasmid primase-like protien